MGCGQVKEGCASGWGWVSLSLSMRRLPMRWRWAGSSGSCRGSMEGGMLLSKVFARGMRFGVDVVPRP